MIPPKKKPSAKALFRGLPEADDGQGRVGPTMAAWKAAIPQDIEGEWPSSPRQLTSDELEQLAMDASTPMGIAGSTRKVAEKAVEPLVERIPTLWHGTNAPAFLKFLRSKMGKGLNKLGVAGYGADDVREGFDYLRAMTDGQPSHIITNKGSKLQVPRETATFLRSGDLSLDDAIANQQRAVALRDQKIGKYSQPKLVQRLKEEAENERSTLYNLLTAADEGIADYNRPGSLLEMSIDADPQKLLNFDKDLVDQTPFVQDAVLDALKLSGPVSPRSREQLFGFNNLLNSKIRTREGSKALENAGIHGVVARSSMNPGVKNYAIFDPDRINVTRTLGLLGLLTGGMAGRRTTTPPQQREQ